MEVGMIFNIQKYSVHDGPGIRTTVFLKGCPLSCSWCHNPESQYMNKEIIYFQDRCTSCMKCIKLCKNNAIYLADKMVYTNKLICNACGECVDACASNAREIVGKTINKKELLKDILKDRIFYDESGGGVTFSGGEPLMQKDFLKDILISCKEEGIHTAVDTSGFSSIGVIKSIIEYVDLFLYDIKLVDDSKHIKYTGVSNHSIFENLKYISEQGKTIYIRVPIIPGINNSEDNINELGRFLTTLKIDQVNLLPYHNMAEEKYSRLFQTYALKDVAKPSENEMIEISKILSSYGLKVKIGG